MTQSSSQDRLSAFLANRSLIRISGADAGHFLNTIITADIAALTPKVIAPAALLSPQGKILFDFLISLAPVKREDENGRGDFLIDIAANLAEAFIARLSLYKLRANVQIDAPQAVLTGIFTNAQTAREVLPVSLKADLPPPFLTLRDMRFPQEISVSRAYYRSSLNAANMETAQQNWDRLRIAFCLPESGRDFALGDNFPHDVNYDCLGAIARQKGCYIGQEVVSRMQHKAAIRKRLVQVEAAQDLPSEGLAILVDGKAIGKLGTVDGKQGLALIRIDKIPPENSAQVAHDSAAAGGSKAAKARANGIDLHFTAPSYLPQFQ